MNSMTESTMKRRVGITDTTLRDGHQSLGYKDEDRGHASHY